MFENYLTVKEVAKRLSVHQETVKNLLRRGDLDGMKLGNTWLVHKNTVEEFAKKYSKERSKAECSKCGYSWTPRVDLPKKCPRCQSWNWQEGEERKTKIYVSCAKCGHTWSPRAIPQRCPRCQSWDWKEEIEEEKEECLTIDGKLYLPLSEVANRLKMTVQEVKREPILMGRCEEVEGKKYIPEWSLYEVLGQPRGVEFFTPAEIAEEEEVSLRRVYYWIESGMLGHPLTLGLKRKRISAHDYRVFKKRRPGSDSRDIIKEER